MSITIIVSQYICDTNKLTYFLESKLSILPKKVS